MDRMAHVLQQLNRLYDKQELTRIDIDLMLDYTRVLYADLLERQSSTEQAIIALPSVEADAIASSDPIPAIAQHSQEPEESDVPGQVMPEAISSTVEKNKPTGISFEPPAKVHTPAEKSSDAWVEEAPETTVKPIELPLEQERPEVNEKPLTEAAPAAIKGFTLPKDIRKSIGINDKYLYLNELFLSHKSNYEETLDRLSSLDTYQQAEEWLWAKVGKDNHWEREDATVVDFFAMLQRFFVSR